MATAVVLLCGSAGNVLAAPSSNDERAAAIAISLSDGASFDLTEATDAPDDLAPCLSGGSEHRSVWFSYTAIETGSTLIGSAADAAIALHVLGPDGTTELGCATAAEPGYLVPHVEIDAAAGQTYLIEVAARSDLPTLGSIVVERPLAVTLDPVTTGHVNAAGVAGFRLTFHCSGTVIVEPEIDLSQGSGANLAMGSDLRSVNCFVPRTVIAMVVEPGHGPNPDARFRNGPARAFIQYGASSFIQTMSSAPQQRTVTLTGGPVATLPPTDTASSTSTSSGDPGWIAALVAILAGMSMLLLVLSRSRSSAGRPAVSSPARRRP